MKKILNLMRENLNAQITALASATGKEVEALRAGLQQQLASLAELDKLPESDVNAAFAAMLQQQAEHARLVFTELQTVQKALVAANQTLAEHNAKVKDGALVTKEVLAEKCGLAKEEGVASCQPEIADLRKKLVVGLPVPPESILKLPATEFASAITEAQANLTAAKEKGLTPDGVGAQFLGRTLWLKKDAFTTELASLEKDFPNLLSGKKADAFQPGRGAGADEVPVAGARRLGMC